MKRALVVIVSVLILTAVVLGVWQIIYHAPILKSETGTFSMSERDEDYRYLEWCNEFSHYITGRLCDYYQLYPKRFKPTGKDEEVEVEGFTDFVKADGYFHSGHFAKIRFGKILDPWGYPVHFVQDLNMDGVIEARGQHGVASDMPVYDDVGEHQDWLNEHHLGVCKENFKGIETQPREIILVWCYHHATWRSKKTPEPTISIPSVSSSNAAAKADAEKLLNSLMPIAKQMLQNYHEVFPFGGRMAPDGTVGQEGAYNGHGPRPLQDFIYPLKQTHQRIAREKEIRACVTIYGIRTVPPGRTEKQDAFAAAIDHVSGYSVVVVFPYTFDAQKNLQVEPPFAAEGAHEIFPRPLESAK